MRIRDCLNCKDTVESITKSFCEECIEFISHKACANHAKEVYPEILLIIGSRLLRYFAIIYTEHLSSEKRRELDIDSPLLDLRNSLNELFKNEEKKNEDK
jgi:hypothetical protein